MGRVGLVRRGGEGEKIGRMVQIDASWASIGSS
jgi:hypothetical protein